MSPVRDPRRTVPGGGTVRRTRSQRWAGHVVGARAWTAPAWTAPGFDGPCAGGPGVVVGAVRGRPPAGGPRRGGPPRATGYSNTRNPYGG